MSDDPVADRTEWPGRKPDGSFHQAYLAQIKSEWLSARDHLRQAAHAGREAQKIWDEAVTHELETHRRMRRILEEAGEPLPEECIP